MKPLQMMMLKNLAWKFGEEMTAEEIKYFCTELVGRFPLVAEDMEAVLSAFIQDRDEHTINQLEERMQ